MNEANYLGYRFEGFDLIDAHWSDVAHHFCIQDKLIPNAFRNSEGNLALMSFGVVFVRSRKSAPLWLIPLRFKHSLLGLSDPLDGADLLEWLKSSDESAEDFSAPVKIGVIDSGIRRHLGDSVDFGCSGDLDDVNPNLHGTLVKDVIQQVNSKAEIVNVKVFDEWADCYYSTVLCAICWCVEKNIPIINVSLADTLVTHTLAYSKILEHAALRGTKVIAAIGDQTGKNASAYATDSLAVTVSTEGYPSLKQFSLPATLCLGPNAVRVAVRPCKPFEGNSAACAVASGAYSLFLSKHSGDHNKALTDFKNRLSNHLIRKP
jgi:hypothetical protein